MKIIENKDNPLLSRKEIKIIIEKDQTPSYKEALTIISKRFNKPEEDIKINQIKGKFGRKTFLVKAKIYNSRKDKDEIEGRKKEKKSKKKKEKAEEKLEEKLEEEKEAGKEKEEKIEEEKVEPTEEKEEGREKEKQEKTIK